ncbi:hypothetical protein AAC387_Pa01g1696 [Persea americana]
MEGNKGHEKKMKVLCLHGFRTSGSFLQKQISKWDPSFLSNFDMVFPDGIFPAGGKSDIEGIFPPPYFEWFQFNPDFTEYTNLDKCISYLCDYITSNGPFDGLLGFSQGATLSALLLGYQAQGKVLKEHPPIKLLVSISGSKFRDPCICEVAYKDPIKVKSVHFIGAKDWLRVPSEELATAFDNPLIVRHPQGHTVPRLDEAAVQQLRNWTMTLLPISVPENGHVNQNGVVDEIAESKQEGAATESNSTKTESMSSAETSVADSGHCKENGKAKAVEAKKAETRERENTNPDSSMETKASNEE